MALGGSLVLKFYFVIVFKRITGSLKQRYIINYLHSTKKTYEQVLLTRYLVTLRYPSSNNLSPLPLAIKYKDLVLFFILYILNATLCGNTHGR